MKQIFTSRNKALGQLKDKKLPSLPPGYRVYAIGDVHGRADLLLSLFDRIDEHRRINSCNFAVTVLLGDYIDRGPQSKEVINLIIERKKRILTLALLGNHEQMMLDALKSDYAMVEWFANGGRETLLSYGVELSNQQISRRIKTLREEAVALVPMEHIEFLDQLPFSLTLGDYFFVHAGVCPNVPIDHQDLDNLLWIREPFLRSRVNFGAVVVHGHTPVRKPDIKFNRINIDTGAYLTGRLTCLILEDNIQTFI